MIRRALAAAAMLLATVTVSTATAASDPYVAAIVHVRSISVPRLLFAHDRQTRAASVEVLLRSQLHSRGRLVAAALAAGRRRGQVRSVRVLWIDGSYAVVARRSFVDALRTRGDVSSVTADLPSVHPEGFDWLTLDGFRPLPSVAVDPSFGAGSTVAVIDSGLDLGVSSIAAAYRGRPHDWFDVTGTSADPVDNSNCYHGTAVAGVVLDAAPGARLIAANIWGRSCTDGSAGDAIQALQWALDPDGDPRTPDAPDVLNASWGNGSTCDTGDYQAPLAALRLAGILPIFPSGNGTTPDSPASLAEAFAVGALADATTVAPFSGRGNPSCRLGARFPDVVAPGVGITVLHQGIPEDGTSYAVPQVSGALAVLLALHPGMTADEQAVALRSTAAAIADPAAGFGRLDVAALLASPLPAARDTTAPILDLPAVIVTRGQRTITITATDAVPLAHVVSTVASVETSFLGAPPATTTGAIATVYVPDLKEGTYPLTAHAVDSVGNVGVADTAQVIVDRTAPVLSGGAVGPTAVTASVTESGSGVATVSLAIDGAAPVSEPASGTSIAVAFDPGLLPDGHHVAHLVATDAADNASAMLDIAFLLDRTPPTVGGARTTLDRSGSARLTAGVGDATFAEWYEGAGSHHRLAISAGAATATLDASAWPPGRHALLVRARDAAGNWSAPVVASLVVPLRLPIRHAALAIRLGGRATLVEEGAPPVAGTLELSFLVNADAATVRGCLTVLSVRDRHGRVLLHVDLSRAGGRLVIRTVRGSAVGAWRTLGRGARLVDVMLPAASVAGVRLGTTSRSAPSLGTLRLVDYRSLVWLPRAPG